MSSSATFTGSVPATYDRYLAYMFDPYAAEVVHHRQALRPC
jgi:hypothetical protein